MIFTISPHKKGDVAKFDFFRMQNIPFLYRFFTVIDCSTFIFFSSFQNQAFKELPLIRPKLSTFLDSEDNRKERGPLKRQIDIYGE